MFGHVFTHPQGHVVQLSEAVGAEFLVSHAPHSRGSVPLSSSLYARSMSSMPFMSPRGRRRSGEIVVAEVEDLQINGVGE